MSVDELAATDIDAAFVARPRASVVAAELDGETVLFDEDTGHLHTLDPVATVVWGCFDGQASLGEIASELAGAFGADRAVVVADVLRLARELGAQGVLDGVAPDPQPQDDATGEERGP